MSLSSLGGMGATALNNIKANFDGIVRPLDAIEARRAARAAEAQQQQEADAQSMKAAAAKQAAEEAQRAGEAKRAGDERVRVAFQSMPKMTVEDMTDPDYVQQMKAQIKYAQNSGEPDLMEMATKQMAQLKNIAETSINNPATQGGAESQARVKELESKTSLQNSMSRAEIPMANKAIQERAMLEIDKYDPGKQGTGIMGNVTDAFKPNYTAQERTRLSNQLAAMVNNIMRTYSANNSGAMLSEDYAFAEARRILGMDQEGGVGAQPQQQPQAQQQQQPQQQAAPSGAADVTFDWSK